MNRRGFVCEVCGKAATVCVADLRQAEPVIDPRDGVPILTWEVHSRHRLCEAHNRLSLEYRPDGTVVTQDEVRSELACADSPVVITPNEIRRGRGLEPHESGGNDPLGPGR